MTNGAPKLLALLAALSAWAGLPARARPVLRTHAFALPEAAEVIAEVAAACDGCDWGRKGREAAALRIELDGRYSQHLLLVRGAEPATYRVSLGALQAGAHTLNLSLDTRWTAARAGRVEVARVATESVPDSDRGHALVAHAPILHARPNTVGRFTDVPLLTWVEEDPHANGRRLRFSTVFSNEDGGTPPDRLLATWGRLTDLEYVYGVELDRDGRVLSAEFQGKEHRILPFAGRREGLHPALYVATDNNMLSDAGEALVRFAPAPRLVDLSGASREAVMDAEPWTYRVSCAEARREGRVAAKARSGDKRIVDPQRYVYLEACAETADVGITFGVGVAQEGGRVEFHDSDGGRREFLILRSADHFPNGCFRGAVALPESTPAGAIRALRFRAWTRPTTRGEAPLPKGSGSARLLRVNKLFRLDVGDRPGPSLFSWSGELRLVPEGPAVELRIGG